jgi:hypothetical protein
MFLTRNIFTRNIFNTKISRFTVVLSWDCWSTVKLSRNGEGRLVNYYNISVPSYFPRGKAISRVVVVVAVSTKIITS